MKQKGVKVERRSYGDQNQIQMLNASAKALEQAGDEKTAKTYREQAAQMVKDSFKSGWYIYYENEIAYFISDPMYAQRRRVHLILSGPEHKELFVMTNWKE